MTNTNELRTFNFHGIELRILIKGRAPWFMAVDAIDALGLRAKQGSSKQYLFGLDDDERFLVGRSMVEQVHISFPNRGATFISESGLYKLIMRSDKPEARKFQDWVTREIQTRQRNPLDCSRVSTKGNSLLASPCSRAATYHCESGWVRRR